MFLLRFPFFLSYWTFYFVLGLRLWGVILRTILNSFTWKENKKHKVPFTKYWSSKVIIHYVFFMSILLNMSTHCRKLVYELFRNFDLIPSYFLYRSSPKKTQTCFNHRCTKWSLIFIDLRGYKAIDFPPTSCGTRIFYDSIVYWRKVLNNLS